ncbi:aldo/keto reductase [Enterobacter sp. R1(2018)]|uniref:aldo/keto reductase n=1 Tax=Enterobacter sp. R1(2018) TaxID=2447891 RepID=UPI000EAED262|nr:aldo/keto reductase [Enterobacter sp. R1(2018)]RKQ39049.1 aldo/keto reductase [Enterobacter sp. R1(2018)]
MSSQIRFSAGQNLPAIGQGTWYMGEKPLQRQDEVHALQAGIDLGLKLIDTAEMYAEGGAERIVGEAIAGRRDEVFLVSKVYPWNAGGQRAIAACEASLKRLHTDYLDLYLLHWRGDIPLEETISVMQLLRQQGKIRSWGVSNFDYADMQALSALAGGEDCAANQVLYHLASRGIEYDLLPWCQQQSMPVMAYCPLAQAGRLREGLMHHPALNQLAAEKGITVAQLLLAWVVSHDGVMAIPKAGSVAHVRENAAALDITLSEEDRAKMEKAFPAPGRKTPLDVV